jgi:hypothetical protein
MHAHLSRDVGEYLMPIFKLHLEHGVRKRFYYLSVNLDGITFAHF